MRLGSNVARHLDARRAIRLRSKTVHPPSQRERLGDGVANLPWRSMDIDALEPHSPSCLTCNGVLVPSLLCCRGGWAFNGFNRQVGDGDWISRRLAALVTIDQSCASPTLLDIKAIWLLGTDMTCRQVTLAPWFLGDDIPGTLGALATGQLDVQLPS